MELLQGETLFKRVHVQGPILLPETVSILEQCCRALGRAHSLGIVHRDIKPDNIYLATSSDDDGYVVKVLDFGIAKVQTLAENEHLSTRTGQLLGTPMYMSPEQARGLRTIDHRTDLYSLGLVAHVMLTGNLAFSSESLGDLLVQICTQPLPSLRAQAPYLPPAVEDWFQKACARDPDQRYPSAQAFVDALRIAAGITGGGERMSALAPMSSEASGSLRPQITPAPTPAQGGMGMTMPLQAGSPSVSTTGGTSREGHTPGVPAKGKGNKAVVLAVSGVAIAAAVLGITLVTTRRHDPPTGPLGTGQGASASGAVTIAPSSGSPSAASATIAALTDSPPTSATPSPSGSGKIAWPTNPGAGHHAGATSPGPGNAVAGPPQKKLPVTATSAAPKGIDLGY
jgi:serine/threonine-protein kinase